MGSEIHFKVVAADGFRYALIASRRKDGHDMNEKHTINSGKNQFGPKTSVLGRECFS